MNLKENINKIHYYLTESYNDVTIKERENKETGKYFEISSFSEKKQLKMKLSFKDLDSQKINWSYSENPLIENSDWIERVSTIDSIKSDIDDIFKKNRFSEDYLKSIK